MSGNQGILPEAVHIAGMAHATAGAKHADKEEQYGRNAKSQLNVVLKQKVLEYTLISVIYLVIALVLFWPVAINITSTVVNGGGSVYQSMWNLWWVNYATFSMHAPIYFTRMLYYPIGASLVMQDLTPLAAFLSAPLQAFGLPFTYNIIFLFAFAFSGLTMFMLAMHLTSNKYASFLAGIIYAFSPVHVAQSYVHLQLTSIEFIPLFVLFMLLIIKERRPVYALGASLSFVFVTFAGGIEQGIMSIVFVALMLIFYISTKERNELINKRFAFVFTLMVVLILLFGSPFLIPLYNSISSTNALAYTSHLNAVQYNEEWSDSLLSFFLPSYFNALFNNKLPAFYNAIFTAYPYERVSYIGYATLALAVIGLYYDYKRHRLKNLGIWLFTAVVFAWLSIGPYLQIEGTATGVPGIYLIYRIIPMFNLISEPGRFDIMLTMSLAIFAAFGFSEIAARAKLLSSRKNMIYILSVLTAIILIEYVGVPLPGSFINTMFVNAHIPKAYYEIGNMAGNFTMLVLPATPNVTSPNLYPGMETYYQTAFKKPMVGGYTAVNNYTQSLSVSTIPIDVSSAYLEQGYGLTYASPISENYTNVTLFWLAAYHTAFISIIRQAYNQSELMLLASYLSSVFGAPVYQSNTTIVFSTSSALEKYAGRSAIAYTSGMWIPGWDFCTPSYCNVTMGEFWWGNATRGLTIYEPTTTRARISFDALAYASSYLYIYHISQSSSFNLSNVAAVLPVSQTMHSYSFNVTLQQGINQIIIAMEPQYAPPANPYINYGIMNVTISSS